MSKKSDPTIELAEAVLRRVKDREELVALRDSNGACTECNASEGHEPGCPYKKLEQEIETAKAEWVMVNEKIGPAEKEYDAAHAAEDKYKNPDRLPEEVAKRTEHSTAALWGWMDRKVALEKRLAKLQSPGEIERRKEVNNRLKEVRRVASKNSKKETARDQGVPGTYLGTGGNFKPGMDARYKSDLIASVLGEKSDKALHQFTKDSAMERLAQRNWLPHLEKAKASREAKAAKAAEKAKAKPARAASSSKKSTSSSRSGGTRQRSSTKAA